MRGELGHWRRVNGDQARKRVAQLEQEIDRAVNPRSLAEIENEWNQRVAGSLFARRDLKTRSGKT